MKAPAILETLLAAIKNKFSLEAIKVNCYAVSPGINLPGSVTIMFWYNNRTLELANRLLSKLEKEHDTNIGKFDLTKCYVTNTYVNKTILANNKQLTDTYPYMPNTVHAVKLHIELCNESSYSEFHNYLLYRLVEYVAETNGL